MYHNTHGGEGSAHQGTKPLSTSRVLARKCRVGVSMFAFTTDTMCALFSLWGSSVLRECNQQMLPNIEVGCHLQSHPGTQEVGSGALATLPAGDYVETPFNTHMRPTQNHPTLSLSGLRGVGGAPGCNRLCGAVGRPPHQLHCVALQLDGRVCALRCLRPVLGSFRGVQARNTHPAHFEPGCIRGYFSSQRTGVLPGGLAGSLACLRLAL